MSYVTDELYKYTEEYKRETLCRSYMRRYIFKPSGNNKEPDGSFSFIISDRLYDFDDEEFMKLETEEEREAYAKLHPDIRTYFKYNSINNRFLSKDVKVCNLPTEILKTNGECPVCKLSKSIDITDHMTGETTHSDGLPLNVFGKIYTASEFLKRTGVMVSVYRLVENQTEFEGKIVDNFFTYRLRTDSVNLMMLSSNYFDISFVDSNTDTSCYVIEVCKVCEPVFDTNTFGIVFKKTKNDDYSFYKIDKAFGDEDHYEPFDINTFSSGNHDLIFYNTNYAERFHCMWPTKNKEYLYVTMSDDWSNRYFDKHSLVIWMYETDTRVKPKSVLYPASMINSINRYTYKNEIRINLNKDFILSLSSEFSYPEFAVYFIGDISSLTYTEDSLSTIFKGYTDILSNVIIPEKDHENFESELLDYYPYWLREQLDGQCMTYKDYIKSVDKSDLIYLMSDDDTSGDAYPCMRFEVPIKHASFMIYQFGRLLSPFAYFEGEHTIKVKSGSKINTVTYGSAGHMYIYINLKEVESDYDYCIKYNKSTITFTYVINIVCTDNYFNEDVIYPLQKVDRYISTIDPMTGEERPIIYDDETKIWKVGTNAEISDDGAVTYTEYMPLENNDTCLLEKINTNIKDDNGDYIYKIDYNCGMSETGEDYYYKASSCEYILPANKNLDEERTIIVAEQMLEYDLEDTIADSVTGLRYGKADYGPYVLLYTGEMYRFAPYDSLSEDELADGTVILDDISFTIQVDQDTLEYIRYKRACYHYSSIIDDVKLYKQNHKVEDLIINTDSKLAYQFKDFNAEIRAVVNVDVNGIINCEYISPTDYVNLISINSVSDLSQYTADSDTDMITINNCKLYAYTTDNGYSKYFLNDETEQFLAYQIPNQLMASDNKLMGFIDGLLTDKFIIDKHLYYKLFDGDTILAFSDDPVGENKNEIIPSYAYDPYGDYVYDNDEYRKDNGSESDKQLDHYSKIISTVYITNPGNYSLYQDAHCITMENNSIFTLGNSIDLCVLDKNKKYKEYWMLPFSNKYMMVFINGVYIPPSYIEVLSNRRFMLRGLVYDGFFRSSSSNRALTIKTMSIYVYDYVDPSKYSDYYETVTEYYNGEAVTVHRLMDTFWDYIDPSKTNYIKSKYPEIFTGDDYGHQICQLDPDDPSVLDINEVYPYDDLTEKDAVALEDTSVHRIDIQCDDTNGDNDILVAGDAYETGTDHSDDFHKSNIELGMYEIFGKYVLNKYDIDSTTDMMLLSEIRSYFDAIYDEDNRLPLDLILDKVKRKYTY